MRSRFLFLFAALMLATSASAATLTLDTGSPSFVIGDTVTVTLTLDLDGNEAPNILTYAQISWDAAVGSATSSSQSASITSFNGNVLWTTGSGTCLTSSVCPMLDQIGALTPIPVDPGQVVATVEIDIIGAGPLNVQVDPDFFDVFGLTLGDVVNVPEPGTGALVALGLLGLARQRRARR